MKTIGQAKIVYLITIFTFLICTQYAFSQTPSSSSAIASSAPTCGQVDDGRVHVPINYNSFTPPPEGQSYVDPQYGCTLTRLTDSEHDSPIVPRHHYYSTLTPFNANSTNIMVFLDNGFNEIRDTHGRIIIPAASMPNSNTGVEPWDPVNPAVFYYVNGNQFLKGTVSGSTVVTTVLHTFSSYNRVIIPDEEDLTDDGTKIWLIGNPSNECAGTGILYDRASDTIVSQSLTLRSCHKIQIFPSGKMLCTNCNGNNITIYNTDGSIYWNPPYTASAHTEVGTDLRNREVLISSANGVASLNACADPWKSLTVIDINAKAPVNCLINGIPPWHVSYRDSSAGWVALSFFDQGACPDYSCFAPLNLAPNWLSSWTHYAEEVVLVKIDGSQVQRLAHHRSRTAEYYWAQSHAAISRDGKLVAFDSNMDISTSGFVSPKQYSDVYLIPALIPALGGGVSIFQPASGSRVSSPTQVNASAAAPPGRTITAMRIYIDNQAEFTASGNRVLDDIALPSGNHDLVVVAWDNTGAAQIGRASFTVAGGAAPCVPQQPGLKICTPALNTNVSSPVEVAAGAKPTAQAITAIRVYVDNVAVFTSGNNSSSIDARIAMPAGQHHLVIIAYQNNGSALTADETITVH